MDLCRSATFYFFVEFLVTKWSVRPRVRVFQLKEVMIESSSGESVTVEHAKGWLFQ